ncbi:MAG: c-type cytochrome [Desulfobulbaceae bacterium]|nr:c-type cytochrome [Desulfobulbaceae bacterium]
MRTWITAQVLTVVFALGIAGAYILMAGHAHGHGRVTRTVIGGNPEQGRAAIVRHGCSACHVIAGIGKASGRVGPKLLEIEQQVYLGGVVVNTPDGMIQWIMYPRSFSPETAMPDLGVPESEARDITAYLYEND